MKTISKLAIAGWLLLLLGCNGRDLVRNKQAGVYLVEEYNRVYYRDGEEVDRVTAVDAGSFVLHDNGDATYNIAYLNLDTVFSGGVVFPNIEITYGEENGVNWYVGEYGKEKLVFHITVPGPGGLKQLLSAEFYIEGPGSDHQEWTFYTVPDGSGSYIKEQLVVKRKG